MAKTEVARATIKVPENLGPGERRDLAEAVIEFIINKVQNEGQGVRRRGNGFEYYALSSKPYTEEYAKKKGVSVGDVDLTLNDEMLNAMEVVSTKKKGEITIGYKRGNSENGKAEGNILGSYGKKPNRKKARPFIGIKKEDLLDLVL